MISKTIDDQPMQRMSECRIRFGRCGSSFLSPTIYKSLSAKIITFSGSIPSPKPFPQRVYRRCISVENYLVSTLVQVLYCLRSYATARLKVGYCLSLLLYNCLGWQGVTNAFSDEVCHVDSSRLPCSFE